MSVKKRELTLTQGKITPNKVRYEEQGDRTSHLVGAVYLPKTLLGDPYPKSIKVTVEWV